MFTMQFVYGFIAGGILCSIAAFLVGRKYPKVANVIAAEANKLVGKPSK